MSALTDEAQAAAQELLVSALRMFSRADAAFAAVKATHRVEDEAYAKAEADFRCAHEVVNIARQALRAVGAVCGENVTSA
jgi:hypothetical protein